MAGVIFLSVVVLWAYVSYRAARLLAGKMGAQTGRQILISILAFVFFLVPVSDEFVARYQFAELCKGTGVFFPTGKPPASGASVKSVVEPRDEMVLGAAVPIRHSRFSYRDVNTEVEVLRYSRYVASGGWLMRWVLQDQAAPPLTFESTCSPTMGLDIVLNFVS